MAMTKQSTLTVIKAILPICKGKQDVNGDYLSSPGIVIVSGAKTFASLTSDDNQIDAFCSLRFLGLCHARTEG
ncbi:MAG: hypothetical protein ACJA0N_000961 [Pseudohongiellaceae bacterium]|jgi:hypothetical protein